MTDREALVEEAASAIWLVRYGARVGWIKSPEDWRTRIGPQVEDEIQREAEAVLAVFEKAHTPTDDERERKHAEMCGCALPCCEFIQGWESAWDIAYRSILRRSEVPEPQDEPSDAQGQLVHEVNMILSSVASHGPAALTDTSDRMYTTGLLRRLRDALNPKPAQRLAAGNAVRAEMARNGLDVHRMVHGQEIANVLAGAALTAALRAALEVTQ